MTKEEKAEALASYIRGKVHRDASTNIRHNDTRMTVEIDLVHPTHGVRVIAFSNEFIDDNDLRQVQERIDQLGIADALNRDHYQPAVLTNTGVSPSR